MFSGPILEPPRWAMMRGSGRGRTQASRTPLSSVLDCGEKEVVLMQCVFGGIDPKEPRKVFDWLAFEVIHALPQSLCVKDGVPANM